MDEAASQVMALVQSKTGVPTSFISSYLDSQSNIDNIIMTGFIDHLSNFIVGLWAFAGDVASALAALASALMHSRTCLNSAWGALISIPTIPADAQTLINRYLCRREDADQIQARLSNLEKDIITAAETLDVHTELLRTLADRMDQLEHKMQPRE